MTIWTLKPIPDSTAPIPATPTTRARRLASRCVRGVLYQPRPKGGTVLLGVLGADSPWTRLRALLDRVPNGWGSDGWRLMMPGLTCPNCGEENVRGRLPLVEQEQNGTIFCAKCGRITKAAPNATAAGRPA